MNSVAASPSVSEPLVMKQLDLVILFTTSACNARCGTSFYWLELNRDGDLSFDELFRLSSTMPEFHDLWISRGEAILRKDPAKVIRLSSQNNHVRDVRIPTNGLPTAQTLLHSRRDPENLSQSATRSQHFHRRIQ